MKITTTRIRLAALAIGPAAIVLMAAGVLGELTFIAVVLSLVVMMLSLLALYLRRATVSHGRRLGSMGSGIRRLETRNARRSDVTAFESRLLAQMERGNAQVGESADLTRSMVARVNRLSLELNDMRDRLDAIESALVPENSDRAAQLEASVRDIERSLSVKMERNFRHLYQQVEAAEQLRSLVALDAPLPPSRGWAASPDLLLNLIKLVRRQRPTTIVECGSGLSTVWLAGALRAFGIHGGVIALEHERAFADETRRLIADHGLEQFAEVRFAPLVDLEASGRLQPWYASDAWSDLDGIDLLLVDGPPAATADMARFPALPLLFSRLSDRAQVVLDDLVRQEEKETLAKWLEIYPSFEAESLPLEKGCAVITRRDAIPSATKPGR